MLPHHMVPEHLCDSPVSVHLVSESEGVSDVSPELLLQDQLDCSQICQLKRKLSECSDGKDLPLLSKPFLWVWRYLSLRDNIVVKKYHDGYVAVVTFHFLISFVLNTHVDMAHIGTFKLL